MALMVYNTLTREKEPFVPVLPGRVGIYLCGPTVYKPSHIGHAVGPIIFDAIKRYLVYRGFKVTWVVNVTDVDDKLIIEAAKQNIPTLELAERVTKDYLAAMRKLHVKGIDVMPKASEHIPDIVRIIQQLIDRGVAYQSGGDVYFDVMKDSDYGKLSNRRVEEQEGQRDLQSKEKRNASDFALWKEAKPDEPDDVKYDSPWGKGRPGWHIECSAMSSRYLGETFDIHGGGMDLIFPHHENEVAQSESASGKVFAKYWLHHGLTRVNTKKISKSDMDPEMQAALAKMTLNRLLENYSGELIRFFILSTHYRRPIEYSEAEIDSKKKGLENFYRLFERVERISGSSAYEQVREDAPIQSAALVAESEKCREEFVRSMEDDFNTAGAIAALFEFGSSINRFAEQERLETGGDPSPKADVLSATRRLVALARVIGIFLEPPPSASVADDGTAQKAMGVLIEIRKHLKKKKDFESADLLRNLLADRKILLEDHPDGTTWRLG
ncbi:MAG: cysteine--tRNA ligase [Planctomycetota bacterium]